MSLETLDPRHRFMYEYGCFIVWWSNFELMMEVGIWLLSERLPKENCNSVNSETAGKKKKILGDLLLDNEQIQAYYALQEVFEVADRNGWIHGHILNPHGDFSLLTRLRIQKNGAGLVIDNSPISFDCSPFVVFYEAFQIFEVTSGIPIEKCNEYISLLQET